MLYEVITNLRAVVVRREELGRRDHRAHHLAQVAFRLAERCGHPFDQIFRRLIGDESLRQLGCRITSYNVCYTKLLRVKSISKENMIAQTFEL